MEKKKLTICFLGEAKPEDIHTVKWAKHFSDKGHDVHLFSYFPFGKTNRVPEITLHLLKKRSAVKVWPFVSLLNIPSILKEIKNKIKEIQPDIIHAHCVTSYGTLGSLLNFHPFIITAWGSDILITPKESFSKKLITSYALSKADLITCDAEHMRKAILKFGVDKSKIKIINFGVDIQKFSPGQKDKEMKSKLSIAEKDLLVISVRALDPLYNIQTLIKSIPLVLKEIKNVKFLIAGLGLEEKIIKDLAHTSGLDERVIFLGQILQDELPNYLRLADVYVSTSLSDAGIASSTAEAMACGLPVVVTDIGDNEKWIKDGQNGFLVPIKKPEILAKRVIDLLRNEQLREQFGREGRKAIEERNNYHREMAKMEEIYYSLKK